MLSLFNDFVCPLALAIPLSYSYGFTGVSIGMALSAYLALLLFSLCSILKFGKNNFPRYLPDYGEESVTFDRYVEPKSITVLCDKVRDEFRRRGIRIQFIDLLLEELYTRIMEKNPDITVVSECSVFFAAEKIRLIVRDSGVIFNFMDENNPIESLNAHVLNSILEYTKEKKYVRTTSFNRNGFILDIQRMV